MATRTQDLSRARDSMKHNATWVRMHARVGRIPKSAFSSSRLHFVIAVAVAVACAACRWPPLRSVPMASSTSYTHSHTAQPISLVTHSVAKARVRCVPRIRAHDLPGRTSPGQSARTHGHLVGDPSDHAGPRGSPAAVSSGSLSSGSGLGPDGDTHTTQAELMRP
jgi:hypothetical protein